MNAETITPEEAKRRVDERRRTIKLDPAKPPRPAGTEAAGIIIKLKVIPDAEAERLTKLRLESENQEKAAHLYARAGVPVRHADNSNRLSRIHRYVPWAITEQKLLYGDENRLHGIGTGFTVALVGLRGNGKTQIAERAIGYATSRGRRALYRTAEGFFMEIKGTYGDSGKKNERDVIADYRKPQLLVLDELDATSQKEWEHRPLFELLNWRYNDKTDTILICNWTKPEFEEAVGPKLCSRMKETGGIIECGWPSFR